MNRRGFLLSLLCCPVRAAEPWETGNAFATCYRKWAELRNMRVQMPGTTSLPELLAWRETKSAWRQLERSQEAEYRGEH